MESLRTRIALTLATSDILDTLYKFDAIQFDSSEIAELVKIQERAILAAVKKLNDISDLITK